MALANYTDLQASVADWLNRSDMTAVIPDWIALAEKRVNGDLDARLQDTVATISTVAGTATVAAPSDVVNIRSMTLQSSPNRVLNYLAPDQFNVQYAFGDSTVPRSFTIIGQSIYLGPVPDAVYAIQLIYKASVPSLTVASPTNWLLTNFPQVYLFATLCVSVMYTKDDERLANWERLYAEAVNTVNNQDWYSGSTMRVRSDVRL